MNKNRIFLLLILLAGLAMLAFRQLPEPEKPPRPPTATPVRGAQLILILPDGAAVSPAWWSVVQWRDAAGRWHDVEGWQGTFDAEGLVVWWVGPEHFGEGPFRWVVYESAERAREIGHSESFFLPIENLSRLEVRLTELVTE
jgi:hypothetical protein